MTITLEFPDTVMKQLASKAEATGKPIEALVQEAVETDLAIARKSFREIFRPFHEAIAESGMTGEEAEEFLDEELHAMRAEKRSSTTKP